MAKPRKNTKIPPLPVDLTMGELETLGIKTIGLEKSLADAQYASAIQDLVVRRMVWSRDFVAAHRLPITPDQLWELYDIDVGTRKVTLKTTRAAAG